MRGGVIPLQPIRTALIRSSENYEAFCGQLEECGVVAYVSFPPISIEVLAARHFHKNTEKLMTLLDAAGVVTIGKPNDFVFPRKAFFDTPYHLNCNSRIERTPILLRQLTISARSANTDSKRTSGLMSMAVFLRILA